jgi:hypothetical protein
MDYICTPLWMFTPMSTGSLANGGLQIALSPPATHIIRDQTRVTTLSISSPKDADGAGMHAQIRRNIGLALALQTTSDNFRANF